MWFNIIKDGISHRTPKKYRHLRVVEYPRSNRWSWWERERPVKYDKIFNIVDFLKTQKKKINRTNILAEMALPTNEDNEAIEFILNRESKNQEKA